MKTSYFLFVISIFISSLISGTIFSQNSDSYKLNEKGFWQSDNGDGTYTNPIIHADYSDPDVIRVGDDFYLTASSFNCIPGLPILHSTDLVNWEIITYALTKQPPYDVFDKPQHGNGVWAPSIRFHDNKFYIYWGDPDFGIYVITADKAEGPWSEPQLIQKAKGWIDPCPFWDEDGKAYLIHAFAGSRAGFKNILVINEMAHDGLSLNEKCTLVFDGNNGHPTTEGPKLYKRNGHYYIFAPAGGVKPGWQLVLRSKNIYGPYEERIVIDQGNTNINGPHQGGFVELESGESWFLHFQDKDAYGRIVHLQPLKWKEDWPVIGVDKDGDGKGEPVLTYKKPSVKTNKTEGVIPVSDEFNKPEFGLQWQWHANFKPEWAFPTNFGFLRLNCATLENKDCNFWDIPNLYLQKLPAEEFSATTSLKFHPKQDGDKTGLILMGEDYASIEIIYSEGKKFITFIAVSDAMTEPKSNQFEMHETTTSDVYFRMEMSKGGVCQFYFSENGINYIKTGQPFTARAGRWIGAKMGIYALKSIETNNSGYADFDWFRVK
ncbi:MAG: glycoside hydrolase 43 family protein [Prolixibacteraceae bacterium]|nr:glycoside hydrolase 43 family protein [Prolixibacteraceae bacterium]